MLTVPPTRLTEPADQAVVVPCPVPAASPHPTPAPPARVVTAEQVEQAVLQLRERPGKTAVEQVHAVLRALGLTVAPPTR